MFDTPSRLREAEKFRSQKCRHRLLQAGRFGGELRQPGHAFDIGHTRENVGRIMPAGQFGERAEFLFGPRRSQRAENDFSYNDRAQRAEMKSLSRRVHRLEQHEERQRRIVRKRLDVGSGEAAIGGGGRAQPLPKLLDARMLADA
jgi:hypothetical protein